MSTERKTNKTSRAQHFDILKNPQKLDELCKRSIELNFENSASRTPHRAALPSLKKFSKTVCAVLNGTIGADF